MHLALATSQTERLEVACESQNERQLWARYIYLLQSRCPSSPLLQTAELWVSNMSSWSGDPVEVMGKRHALAEAILSGCTAVPDTARSKTDDDDTLPASRQARETEAEVADVVASESDAPLVVRTGHGPVKGFYQGAARAFLGIPYAKPPVGNLRFRKPASPDSWSAIAAATEWPNACIGSTTQSAHTHISNMSEDCLCEYRS